MRPKEVEQHILESAEALLEEKYNTFPDQSAYVEYHCKQYGGRKRAGKLTKKQALALTSSYIAIACFPYLAAIAPYPEIWFQASAFPTQHLASSIQIIT